MFKFLTAISFRDQIFREFKYILKCTERCCSKVAPQDTKFKTIREVKMEIMSLMGVEKGCNTVSKSRSHLQKYIVESQNELPVKKMSDSYDVAFIPLKDDVELQEKYESFIGQIRFGRLMEDMDIFAVWCVLKHIKNEKIPQNIPLPYVVATLLVDQIDFMDFIPKSNANIRLSGHVCWVGKSSLEVVVWLEQESEGKWKKITRAFFLMAVRNANNTGPAVVNQLEPQNAEEMEIFLKGEERRKRRIQAFNKSLLKDAPDVSEQKLIHELFLKTVNQSEILQTKRILPKNCIWMKDACLSNIIFCHPEDRNLYNKVFGGFLMRQALELSWSAAYMHCKCLPSLLQISDVAFHRPVDVGSMLKMHSYIVFTDDKFMQIAVYAEVYNYQTGMDVTTNVFHYTYESLEPVTQIIPKSYHEAMMYLDGKRHFHQRMSKKTESTNREL